MMDFFVTEIDQENCNQVCASIFELSLKHHSATGELDLSGAENNTKTCRDFRHQTVVCVLSGEWTPMRGKYITYSYINIIKAPFEGNIQHKVGFVDQQQGAWLVPVSFTVSWRNLNGVGFEPAAIWVLFNQINHNSKCIFNTAVASSHNFFKEEMNSKRTPEMLLISFS